MLFFQSQHAAVAIIISVISRNLTHSSNIVSYIDYHTIKMCMSCHKMHSVNLHLYKLSVHKIPFHSKMKFSVCEKFQCVTEQRRQRKSLLLPLPLGCISISIGWGGGLVWTLLNWKQVEPTEDTKAQLASVTAAQFWIKLMHKNEAREVGVGDCWCRQRMDALERFCRARVGGCAAFSFCFYLLKTKTMAMIWRLQKAGVTRGRDSC